MKRLGILRILAACLCIISLLTTTLSVSAEDVQDYAVTENEINQEQTNEESGMITEDENAVDAPQVPSDETAEAESDQTVTDAEELEEEESGEKQEELQASNTQIVNFRKNSSGNAVTSTTSYTEYESGEGGYLYGACGADAAYLGTVNGKVKFMISGVIGLVDASKVQLVQLDKAKSYSNYYTDGNYIIHRISTNIESSGYGGSINVGPQQSYMTTGATYYSYDGHYFYTNYDTMLSDYKAGTRSHSINPGSPYYNYFQFLPLRGLSKYSGAELTQAINVNASSGSKMYNTGTQFANRQNDYGVNALLMASIAANESGWGSSSIAQNKNNLFGINAVDSSPGESATYFDSADTCIRDFAEVYMSNRYLRPGWSYYHGGYLGNKAGGINVSYASDQYWGERIAGIAWRIDNNNGKKDQYQYSIGMKDMLNGHTSVNVRKEATTASTSLYMTGSTSDYAVMIIGESGGFYKIQCDPVLTDGRSAIDKNSGAYSTADMYAYISKDYVTQITTGNSSNVVNSPKNEPETNSIVYSTHVQTYGWQEDRCDGDIAGTTGLSKRLEGIKIGLNDAEYNGSVQYRTHVQTYGWQDWKSDGQMSGTTGEAKRLEAIQIKLTGEMAKQYDVYYRVHAQTYGWLGWTKNGQTSGTEGIAKRLEAIQIVLVKKGGAAPGDMTQPCVQGKVQYRTHVQTYGWQNYVFGGSLSGTTGQAKRLEAIQISLPKKEYSGSVQYRTHVQTYGWQGWKNEGQTAGTSGQAKRLEAIQIKLTGEMASKYDIYYRVHSQTYGWLDWAKNGEMAGTEGLAKRLESIQILLVEKGGTAPGSTTRPYISGE